MSGGWNLGDVLDILGARLPGTHPALIHGDEVIDWASMTARSNAIAHAFNDAGLAPGDKVAFYLRNGTEYMELLAACLKGRFTHVNINHRYQARELSYVLDNSDAAAVVYSPAFRPLVEAVRDQLPGVKLWVESDAVPELPAFAVSYEALAAGTNIAPLGIDRLPEDPIFLYTGGTTGMPKGVIWPQTFLLQSMFGSLKPLYGYEPETMDELVDFVMDKLMDTVQLPAAPFMHSTGMCVAMGTLVCGGTVATLESAKFDADELWQVVERRGATNLTIIGDVFARPMLAALDAAPGRYDLSSVRVIASSGTMWSAAIKEGLIRHMPDAMLLDSLGSTEAPSCGITVTTAEGTRETMSFGISDNCKVFNDRDEEVVPGSGEVGLVARSGLIPLGYYKDEAKTASTFRTVNGVRYAFPGDMCKVEADGRLVLLGRGSACINTGGEKVFAEEVEECLKEHADVVDAVVFGLPDETWGQAVTAVVLMKPGVHFEEGVLRNHVREHLAAYKAPKRIWVKDDLERYANGKANYDRMKAFAQAQLQPA